MKRLIIMSALLLATAACTTPAPSNSTPPANTNATNMNNGNTSAQKPAESISEADLMSREKKVWEAIKNKDWESFGGYLTDDQIYVGSQGVMNKQASIESLKNSLKDVTVSDASLTDFKTLMLDKDAAIVTYMANMTGTMNGKELPPMPQRNSSVWVNRGGKWQVIFHQDTDAAKVAKNAPAGPALTPKAAVGLTEADAIAREKQAWDAIKKKDWDSFTSMLADDELEIENDGVYDKAGTLNGLSQSNMPEMALSDFKATKIDDDAAIVTYIVKPANAKAGDAASNSTTIWVNRGGKWLAVFHQGTEAKAEK